MNDIYYPTVPLFLFFFFCGLFLLYAVVRMAVRHALEDRLAKIEKLITELK